MLTPKLEEEKQELFKKHIQDATKFLLSKLSDLQLYALIYKPCALLAVLGLDFVPFCKYSNQFELLGVCSFVGESMHDDGGLVFAYYKEGATDPTFIYLAYGLKEVKH